MNPETLIQRQISDYLTARGHKVIRFNNIGIRGHTVKQKGISDLLVCKKPTGRFVGIEVKTTDGKPTEEQTHFIKEIILAGGDAFVARSVEDCIKQGL